MTYPKAGTPASPASRRAWPKPPAWETWIVSIGVALCHAPTRSRISRLAYDSAIGRNEAAREVLSRTATRNPVPRRARASAQPTGPAPWMRTSVSGAGIAHQRLDVLDALRRFGGNHLAAALGDEDVVLDTDADVVQRLWHIAGGTDIEAGLDRQHHARREAAPLSRTLVIAGIVHVEAQPVPGAVHIEALVGFLLEDLVERSGKKPEVEHALREDANRCVVRLVPGDAGAHFADRRELRREHHLVGVALRRAEPAVHREAARHVRGVAVELAPGVDQQQVAAAQRRIVGDVVQHAGIRPPGDDRPVRGELRAAAPELVEQLGFDLVLVASRARRLHRAPVRAGESSSSATRVSSSLPIGCASSKPKRSRAVSGP